MGIHGRLGQFLLVGLVGTAVFLTYSLVDSGKAGACNGKAGSSCVVVEMFTSQGCSSCPPADKFMSELGKRKDVLTLSQHVDYWDYIGWKDLFSQPWISKRQRQYSANFGERTVYTPQAVVSGWSGVVGARRPDVRALVNKVRESPSAAVLSVRQQVGHDAGWALRLAPGDRQSGQKSDLLLVAYNACQRVDIKRGENSGRTVEYHNVVRSLREFGSWDGESTREILVTRQDLIRHGPSDNDHLSYAVMVQGKGVGRIIAAARLLESAGAARTQRASTDELGCHGAG